MLGSEAEEIRPSLPLPRASLLPWENPAALIDPGPVVNERDIGVNELGADNTDNPASWLGEGVCLPCHLWTN